MFLEHLLDLWSTVAVGDESRQESLICFVDLLPTLSRGLFPETLRFLLRCSSPSLFVLCPVTVEDMEDTPWKMLTIVLTPHRHTVVPRLLCRVFHSVAAVLVIRDMDLRRRIVRSPSLLCIRSCTGSPPRPRGLSPSAGESGLRESVRETSFRGWMDRFPFHSPSLHTLLRFHEAVLRTILRCCCCCCCNWDREERSDPFHLHQPLRTSVLELPI